MARPKRLRRLAVAPPARSFLPGGQHLRSPRNKAVTLTLDEFEALRLADHERDCQEDAARKMGISRQTFGRIAESGRSKVARALVEGSRIEIAGGAYMFGRGRHLQCPRCKWRQLTSGAKRGLVECRRCCQPLQNSDDQSRKPRHTS